MDDLRHQLSAVLAALVMLIMLGGCGVVAAADEPPAQSADVTPLRGGLASLDALGQALVAGLNARDPAALRALLVEESDFKNDRLFAALSNHASAQQLGPGLLWDMQARQGADELARALELHGGRGLRFVGLEAGRVELRGDIRLHRRPALVVEDGGAQARLQIVGSIVEHVPSGTFKLLTFRVRG